MKALWTGIVVAAALMGVSSGQTLSAEALARKSGCFECHNKEQPHIGPSFREIAGRYNDAGIGYDVKFMTVSNAEELPEQRNSQVIIAMAGNDLHIRVFDSEGRKVVDKGAGSLNSGPEKAELLNRLKEARFAAADLSQKEKQAIIESALSAAGHTGTRARSSLIEIIRNGGKGHWTAISKGVPMPPFWGRLTDAEIARLADWVLRPFGAVDLRVMKTGLGSGAVSSNPAGIDCGGDCDQTYSSAETVTLTATPDAGSVFVRWEGDASGAVDTVTVTMDASRSVRAVFGLATPFPELTDFTPGGIQNYLTANPGVNTPARFISALPPEYKRNWLLMSRSESLQTGTAEYPRVLLPGANAQSVFSFGLATHSSYPGSHPNAIEYMQWDGADKNFRFHEIVLDNIPAMGTLPPRTRSVSIDDNKCSRCHSTHNVLNRSSFPGTDGIPPRSLKVKNKPNWDAYDSWGGLMPFNRDRIYQGSVEAAAFRKTFNPWTWSTNPAVWSVIEQLELQPPGVPPSHVITRTSGGPNDGHINFTFDASPPVLTEPPPTGSQPSISTNYSFNGAAGTGLATAVTRGGSFVTLHHSNIPTSDEGRAVRFFDALGGLASTINQQRIADELVSHRFATGSVPIDVRPIALALSRNALIRIDTASNTTVSTPGLTIDLAFFDARNGMRINELVADTRARAESVPRRKADIQKLNLDRTGDEYLFSGAGGAANGLIQQFGGATSAGADISFGRVRQEIFRRHIDAGDPDSTVMGGIYVDRELYSFNTGKMALYRYFLEPLGVSVDKWSMGVRGRSRTYSFADVFDSYRNTLSSVLTASLLSNPVAGLTDPNNDTQLIAAVNSTLSALPPASAVPPYTDIQRIFNKSCIECHGGLNYPPYMNYGTFLDFSENESPPPGERRLERPLSMAMSYTTADPATSSLFRRITRPAEDCPYGLMPCGGPALSKTNIETIRRWIVGGRPNTEGDPHIQTVDGVSYDFQAAGEFVFLQDENLEIQVRQTPVNTEHPLGPNAHTGLTSCVSVNTAAAIRIGRDRITCQPNLNGKPDPDGLQLRVGGELRKLDAKGIALSSGGRIIPTIAPGGLQIEAAGGTVIVITPGWWDHYQIWYLNINARNVRATQGLMGAIAPGNWLPALPDGTLPGPRPEDLELRHRDLYDRFGNAWRVNDRSSLFDYAAGSSTKTFTLESWPGKEESGICKVPEAGGIPARPPLKSLTKEEAARLAADIGDPVRKAHCIQDLMTTGETGFVRTYLLADQIMRHVPPAAPALKFPEDNRKGVDKSATFSWEDAKQADGEPVSYKLLVWHVNDPPNNNNAVAVIGTKARTASKLEQGKAYFWRVIAEDGKGGTTESETRRFEMK